MTLREVRSKEQFPIFYAENNLTTIEDKIKFLTEEMGILFSRSDEEFTPQEELSTLQQYALYSWDRHSYSNKVPA